VQLLDYLIFVMHVKRGKCAKLDKCLALEANCGTNKHNKLEKRKVILKSDFKTLRKTIFMTRKFDS
jgi:hypothetical protein